VRKLSSLSHKCGELTMGAPSSVQEAKDRAAAIERCPRARAVNDRLQSLIESGATTKEERIRYESLAIAIGYSLETGTDIDAREFQEWRVLLRMD
jgi:hypothetical protein